MDLILLWYGNDYTDKEQKHFSPLNIFLKDRKHVEPQVDYYHYSIQKHVFASILLDHK